MFQERSFYKKAKYIFKKLKLVKRRISTNALSKKQLKNEFKSMGLKKGQSVFVHSSLSSLGYVKGGVDTVVDSLIETVGREGTVAVPTFPFSGSMADYVENYVCFDVNKTPSKMGIITEKIREKPSAVRSPHPTHPVAAIGSQALYLTKDHDKSLFPFDKNSPFYRLIELKGKVLLLGASYETMTIMRTFECVVENYPLPIYFDNPVTLKYFDANHEKKEIVTKVQNPRFSKVRKNEIIGEYLDKNSIAKIRQIGNATVRLVDVGDLLVIMDELLKKNIIGYQVDQL